jgi:RNA polymerase sigma-70 factor (ECF subfamily)
MNPPAGPHSFNTTRWSVVRQAVGKNDAQAQQALSELCEAYWYPLYAYIRRSGKSAHDAEDLTQSFFARLLEHDILASANPDKGKLRTFLLTCVRHFLSDEHDRAMAQKRGAGLLTSFDAAFAEQRYASEPADHLSPDRLFQRRWAITVLDFSLQTLAAEFTGQGKAEMFAAMRPFLGFGTEPERRYEEVAASLGMAMGTVKSHVFRLRQRWRELLFEQVAATLDDPTPEEIKAELSELLGCV